MHNTEIKTALERNGIELKLVDDKLAVCIHSGKMNSYMLKLLPGCQDELIWLLKLEESLNPNKPYLTTPDSGMPEKILLVPTDCHPKYRYWLPPIKCFVVAGEDWLTNPEVKEWRPYTIEEILRKLNAPKVMTAKYNGFKMTSEVLEKAHYGRLEDDWYECENQRNDLKLIQSRFFERRQLDTQQS